jgi:hypothetical protein
MKAIKKARKIEFKFEIKLFFLTLSFHIEW